MRPVDLTSAAAEQQIGDRIEQARKARLVAIARCCRPSVWMQALARAVAVVTATRGADRRSRLQPGICC